MNLNRKRRQFPSVMLLFSVCSLLNPAAPLRAQTTDPLATIRQYPVVPGVVADVVKQLTNRLRLQISGTVLLEFAPGYFFLHDDTGCVRVRYIGTNSLQRGDKVELIGLPRIVESLPWLIYAEAQRVGEGTIPEPLPIRAEQALQELHDAEYVTLRGRVIGTNTYALRGATNEVLLLDSEGVLCKALFTQGTGAAKLFPADTVADFTGVCRLGGRVDESRTRYVHILMHRSEDVRVIETPPRFTAAALQRILIGTFAVVAAAAVWIAGQRRKAKLLSAANELARRSAAAAELLAANERLTRAENDLRVALAAEKELSQLKSSFVSMVSHEFRTPLEVILSSSNILDRYLDRLPPDKRAAQLRAIRKSVHRMNDLIDDVLLLGKFDAGALTCQPTPLDLTAFCRRAANEIESAAAREGIICFRAAALDGEASADEGLLQHILTNILGNAVKYSPPDRAVEFSVAQRGPDAEFVILDRGCGIPPADQARLFTAFYRGSNVGQTSGSGLGLVIAKRCVDLHGGTIRCESEPGIGTTFIVTLPLFDGTRIFRQRFNRDDETPQPKVTHISKV